MQTANRPAVSLTTIIALFSVLSFTFPVYAIQNQTTAPSTAANDNDQRKNTPEKVYPIGGGIQAPRALSTPPPDYSDRGRKKKIQGEVVISGYVGTDGAFHDPIIFKSLEKSLDANALVAVKKWKFRPCAKDGQPVNCEMKVEIGYHLYRSR